MARGLGWVAIALLVGMSVPVPGLADAQPYSEAVCTVSFEEPDEGEGLEPVTACIHTETGNSTTGGSGTSHLQIAAKGCFYFGSRPTVWVDLGYTGEGEIAYGWSPNGKPGEHLAVGTARPCSWTRVENEEIEGYMWSRIGSYHHQSPRVSFDPPIPRGMVGIETFAALDVPSPWTYSSRSPYTGRSLRAEVRVREVTIAWDDGPQQRFRGSDLSGFTGYPNGVGRHMYQVKSCAQSKPRCREEIGAYQIKTSFVWSGWYQVATRRRNLDIPNTTSTADYPVSEMIPLVVG